MTNTTDTKDARRTRRKPIWPWLLLLVMTLLAIYTWDRANALFDEFSRDMPAAVIELFQDIFREFRRGGQSSQTLEVEVTPVDVSR